MPTNITLDDTSPDIVYSPNWAAVNKNDANLPDFFQSTYHGAQADEAYANLTFTGSAVYIYGTKGPSHANYSIQFDGYIIFYSASEPTLQYQQPLFSFTFNETGNHFVSVRTRYVEGGNWLDLDYITITAEDSGSPFNVSITTSTAASVSQTVWPPWFGQSSSTASSEPASNSIDSSSSAGGTSDTSSSASSSSSKITLVLSIVFGVIILVAFAIFLLFYFLRKRRSKKRSSSTTSAASLNGGSNSKHRPPPMRQLSSNLLNRMTFTTTTQTHRSGPSTTTHSGSIFDSPLNSPGLLSPDAFRTTVDDRTAALFSAGIPSRDRGGAQTPSTFAFSEIGSPPQFRDMYNIPAQPILQQQQGHMRHASIIPETPLSTPAFGSSSLRSASPLSTSHLLPNGAGGGSGGSTKDRHSHQRHTPTGSETVNSAIPLMQSHQSHSREGSGAQQVSLTSPHLTLTSTADSPSTALFEQALLQPPNPHPPPSGPLPLPPSARRINSSSTANTSQEHLFVDAPRPSPTPPPPDYQHHEQYVSVPAASPPASARQSPSRPSFANSPPASPNPSQTFSTTTGGAQSLSSSRFLNPSTIEPSGDAVPIALTIDPNSFGMPPRKAPQAPPRAIKPLRPTRPMNGGLLDWFGSLEKRSMKNSERAMKAMEDGNSSKTNFLKMF